MFDKDLHKEFIFCTYLAKLLPSDPVTPLDLDNRVKWAYYKQGKTFEGSIEPEKMSGSWAPTNPKKAGSNLERLSPLEEMI